MVPYLVWDSESEATKESTLLSTGMKAVDDEDSDESSEDDVESKEGWGKADFTCRRHVSIIRSVLFSFLTIASTQVACYQFCIQFNL